jgi:hypothetical protein
MADNPGQGQMDLSGDTSDFNKISFIIQQSLALVAGSTLVQVVKCTKNDEVGAIGFVDVQPLVNMLDGAGVAQKHGVIYNLPYARVQGGRNAVICDPCKDDIGVAVFADRDISSVKKNQAISNPGTRRRNNMSDGIYLFTVLSKLAPQQWVRFIQDGDGAPNGMEWQDKFGNIILSDTDGIKINGVLFDRDKNVSNAAKIDATDEITAFSGGADSVGLSTHTHGGVAAGSADTDPPTGGT